MIYMKVCFEIKDRLRLRSLSEWDGYRISVVRRTVKYKNAANSTFYPLYVVVFFLGGRGMKGAGGGSLTSWIRLHEGVYPLCSHSMRSLIQFPMIKLSPSVYTSDQYQWRYLMPFDQTFF